MNSYSQFGLLIMIAATVALSSCSAAPKNRSFLAQSVGVNTPLEITGVPNTDRLLNLEGTVRLVLSAKSGDNVGMFTLLIEGRNIKVRAGGVDHTRETASRVEPSSVLAQKIASALIRSVNHLQEDEAHNANLLIEVLQAKRRVRGSEWKFTWVNSDNPQ